MRRYLNVWEIWQTIPALSFMQTSLKSSKRVSAPGVVHRGSRESFKGISCFGEIHDELLDPAGDRRRLGGYQRNQTRSFRLGNIRGVLEIRQVALEIREI